MMAWFSILADANVLFQINNIIIIGWLALIFFPLKKPTHYVQLLPAVLLASIYTVLLLQKLFLADPDSAPLDFFSITGWLNLLKDPYMIVGTTNHFCVCDLWVGKWVVNDFYTQLTLAYVPDANGVMLLGSWTKERYILTLNLLLLYMVSPLGFIVYQFLKHVVWSKYKAPLPITPVLVGGQVSPFWRKIRFGDDLPTPFREFYFVLRGIAGFACMICVLLTILLLMLYSKFAYRVANEVLSEGTLPPSKYIPYYFRNFTADLRLKLTLKHATGRGLAWKVKFYILQIATLVEYIPNSTNPVGLFSALCAHFKQFNEGAFFAFGDGIGVSKHALVKRYLQEMPPEKTFESLGWAVSSSQANFCDLTSIFLNSNDPNLLFGRAVIHKWVTSFLTMRTMTPEQRMCLDKIIPRHCQDLTDADSIFKSVGETMFFLATGGGELSIDERKAYLDCVKNPSAFFPNWFNFMLAGNYLERSNYKSYNVLLEAFSRHEHTEQYLEIFEFARNYARQHNIAESFTSNANIMRLISIVFAIAGAAAPAKLTVSVIKRLWSSDNQAFHFTQYSADPIRFIKECARLDKAVPMVNVVASSKVVEDISRETRGTLNLPVGSLIHCSIVNANTDPVVFEDANKFNPERTSLNQMIVWNGVEENVMDRTAPRYCPGHDFSLEVINYIADRYAPLMAHNATSVEEKIAMFYVPDVPVEKITVLWKGLDIYTRLVYQLMVKGVSETNTFPARGIDIGRSLDFPGRDIRVLRNGIGKFLPMWDEDQPFGTGFQREVARWLVNLKLWDFSDLSSLTFASVRHAVAWRLKYFEGLPMPNAVLGPCITADTDGLRVFDEDDSLMTRMAFFGSNSHNTKQVGAWEDGSLVDKPANAVYANNNSALYKFRVRAPYERYGAVAYFDDDFRVVAIYWCHRKRLVKPGDAHWYHAKLVWRSSYFMYTTVIDHLLRTHMIESNVLVTTTRTMLPHDHPLRTFLKPFTYRTVTVNYTAGRSLINERGLVHRIWAFEYDEFVRVCDFVTMNYVFRRLPDLIDATMHRDRDDDAWDAKYPVDRDLNSFWEVVRDYVRRFFAINYGVCTNGDGDVCNFELDEFRSVNSTEDEDLTNFCTELSKQLGIVLMPTLRVVIDVLAQLICSGSGWHEHVGQVSDYVLDPRMVATKLLEGNVLPDVQSYTQLLVLTEVTGFKMPGLLEDWSHLLASAEPPQLRSSYAMFRAQLFALSRSIEKRNAAGVRDYPFNSFNPRNLECSTSV